MAESDFVIREFVAAADDALAAEHAVVLKFIDEAIKGVDVSNWYQQGDLKDKPTGKLFVGVASVCNDPTWQDGGPQGRFQTYWQNYSFGDLNESAKTRADVLTRLLPRLKIKDKCKLVDKFLVVAGSKRTYKIHLGSGNILMEPNDQYLCIVADRSTTNSDGSIFLPFEGDSTLSLIISKAFLLADDVKIVDPTILRQIAR